MFMSFCEVLALPNLYEHSPLVVWAYYPASPKGVIPTKILS